MDRIGATIEAVTDRDCMFLRAQVPSKKVEECLKLLAELYMFPSFPEPDVDRERGSEKLEYERIRQDPMTASMTDVWEATFPQNPLGHPVTGYPSTIEKITPKTLDEFDEKVREDAPLVVAVVGPQEENMIIEFADSCFEKVKVKPRVEKINPRPRRDFNILRSALRAKQTTFTVGTVTSGASSSDYPALLLLEDYLGSERHYAGTLFRELREKRGLTYFAGSRLFALRDCGLLTAYTGVKHEKVSEALRLMLQCMTELRDKNIPEKMMEELKIFHRQVVEVMLEVPFRAATWLATNMFRGAEVDLESYISKIQTVTPENIRRVAEGSLTASCMALSASGNPPDEKTLAKIMRGEMG